MKIYMHCLTNQDLTKQFAYTDEIRREFFDNANDQDEIAVSGLTSNREVKIKILTATDCRFNANFKYLLSQEGNATIGDIVIFYKKGFKQYDLELITQGNSKYSSYKELFSDPRHLPIYTNAENFLLSSAYTSNFTQTIFYGVPGSGKSHKIDEATKDLPDEQKMRVVFHPEYTNADFVGQILPSNADGTISYKFKPGPFTKILRRAYLNPSKGYCLIIEEINRGNAAAIFGDVFQLLDRITDGKGEASGGYSYGNGWSRYSIENEFMNWYIRENLYADTNHKLQNEDDGIATKSADESQKAIEIGELHFSALTGIRLPPNLSLYATMNTSDQNVFTLDNAFQRRWDMQLVKNECEDENQMDATITVNKQKITWRDFQETINAVIGEKSNEGGLSSMEDKRLGCWFVKAENGEISKEKFADKVLKYLWDDAFKFYHQEMFKGGIKNFEELHKTFLAEGFSVFSDECRLEEKLKPVEKSTDSELAPE